MRGLLGPHGAGGHQGEQRQERFVLHRHVLEHQRAGRRDDPPGDRARDERAALVRAAHGGQTGGDRAQHDAQQRRERRHEIDLTDQRA